MGRRGLDDAEWKAVKAKVRELDGNKCVFCKCLTPGEMVLFNKAPKLRNDHIECAHRHPVGLHAEECYDVNNIFCACPTHHTFIDHYQSPVDGSDIDEEEHEMWWDRAASTRNTKCNNKSVEFFLDI